VLWEGTYVLHGGKEGREREEEIQGDKRLKGEVQSEINEKEISEEAAVVVWRKEGSVGKSCVLSEVPVPNLGGYRFYSEVYVVYLNFSTQLPNIDNPRVTQHSRFRRFVAGGILRQSEFSIRIAVCTVYSMYVQGGQVEIQTPKRLEPDRPQHENIAACVIAQQYCSSTLVSLRF
jgi:hypothetical protein